MYYLNSRYYNPEWCRFINADGIIGANQDIISLNLYAYVSNAPSSVTDNMGYWGIAIVVGIIAVGATVVNYAATKLKNSTGMFAKAALKPEPKKYGNSSSLAQTAKQSNKLKKVINSEIDVHKKTNKKKSKNTGSSDFYGNIDNTDKDLKYSVGAFSYEIEITTEPNSYIVNMTIVDIYDFTEWKKGLSLGNVLNNGAFVLQKVGIIQPYPWVLNYQVEIAKDDIN